jgi:predicted RNA-binding Zn ribbon-like protein
VLTESRIPEAAFLAVLNSAPRVNGMIVDRLADPADRGRLAEAQSLAEGLGGDGSAAQRERLREARDQVHAVVRGQGSPGILRHYLERVVSRPALTGDAVRWELDGPADDLPAARLVLEWDRLAREMPGRLRACANPECTKFLIDHSKPNTARWCSMATCGNKLKARRHQARKAVTA